MLESERLRASAAVVAATRTDSGIEMIRFGKSIRLTRREVERFTQITGFEPVGVKTLDDLDAYIRQCKNHYFKDGSKEAEILHWLVDEQLSRCVGAA